MTLREYSCLNKPWASTTPRDILTRKEKSLKGFHPQTKDYKKLVHAESGQVAFPREEALLGYPVPIGES